MACFQTFWTHYNTSYDTCDRYLGQQLIKCLHAPNEQPKGDQPENLFRALTSDYLKENKADLATNLSEERLKKAELLARNGEVVA